MSSDQEKFQIEYQAGKAAFESGEYRVAVQRLQAASALMSRNTILGGEAQIWLVMAYEAAGQTEEAIALCQQLTRHPNPETSKQGKRLLYILQAPQLKRPEEWMTKIPDLGAISESDPKDRRASGSPTAINNRKPKAEAPFVDLSQVETKDNQFIWVAIIILGLLTGAFIWLGS